MLNLSKKRLLAEIYQDNKEFKKKKINSTVCTFTLFLMALYDRPMPTLEQNILIQNF